MPEYQVFARKYRPQTFHEVLGQDAIVTTLKNAIQRHSLAHAYLFCGARGTGKTTLARILAKALNCANPTSDGEPCNLCASCREISAGNSLDVLEIDGASHRGIDDIRLINENVGYTPAYGKYKIYIIDEVHMLTKEAFNALLKTLEEPPAKVLFFFATTEPHKILPTIVSRCQRFNLKRLSIPLILLKLQGIAKDLNIQVEEAALQLLASHAEGGMRDAESLFDQIVSFHEGDITEETVSSILGLMPRTALFELDKAGKEGNLQIAFDLADRLFSQGKEMGYFLENLTEHYRNILLIKVSGKECAFLHLSDQERLLYETSASFYSQEQCLAIIDFLMETQRHKMTIPFGKVALEALLLRILRIHQRIPIDLLVRRLVEIEKKLSSPSESEGSISPSPGVLPSPSSPTRPVKQAAPLAEPTPVQSVKQMSLIEDPTPSFKDLGVRKPAHVETAPSAPSSVTSSSIKPAVSPASTTSSPMELGARSTEEARLEKRQQQSRIDTLLQFASVELDGNLKKKSFSR
jgi:DNA polymerase-3 subunit gamma/tau